MKADIWRLRVLNKLYFVLNKLFLDLLETYFI